LQTLYVTIPVTSTGHHQAVE